MSAALLVLCGLVQASAASPAKKAVDARFEALRRTPKNVPPDQELYESLVATGRPDVLAWIRSRHDPSRRLRKPNDALSATADADGDGLPDAVDANPYAAPREFPDDERMLATAFEWTMHAYRDANWPVLVTFPNEVQPFELPGSSGTVFPKGLEPKDLGTKMTDRGYALIRVRLERSRASASPSEGSVEVGFSPSPRGGHGERITMRKIGSEWYVVRTRMTWIS